MYLPLQHLLPLEEVDRIDRNDGMITLLLFNSKANILLFFAKKLSKIFSDVIPESALLVLPLPKDHLQDLRLKFLLVSNLLFVFVLSNIC
jgi:hypothetical protein